jgi:hypothetical protein
MLLDERDSETEAEEFSGLTYEEQEKIAKDCIKSFFAKESFCWGGPIPQKTLFSAENVELVLTTTIIDGVDRIYNSQGFSEETKQRVLDVLNLCGKRWMPKHLAGGLMLMYFTLCEGLAV